MSEAAATSDGTGETDSEGRRILGSRKRRSASATSRGRHGRRGGRILAIAVAAVLAFGAVAFASTVIDPDSPLLTLFDPEGKPLTDDEVALAQAGGTVIDKSVEKDGMKVHVREAIGDKDSVYLLFDVTPPKGVAEPGAIYAFEHLALSPKSSLLADGSTGISGALSGELSEDGTIHFIMSANASGGVQGKTFTLGLKNLLRTPGDDESEVYDPFETVVEGEWEVTFKLDYKDNSVALDADENVVIDGDSFRLNDVRISPLSLAYSLTHTAGQIDDTISIFDVLEEGLPVVVKMKDGTKYDMSEIASQGGGWHGDNRTYRRIMQFNRVTDPEQIESISFGDYVVKL
jgi:hypothetical protein